MQQAAGRSSLVLSLLLFVVTPAAAEATALGREIRHAVARSREAGHRAVKVGGAIVNHRWAEANADRLIGAADAAVVGALDPHDLRLLESVRVGGVLDTVLLQKQEQQHTLEHTAGWKNPLAGAFHKGVAIPFWNGHACATGIMPGPEGACFRDKSLGKAALGCTGTPKKDLDWYASEHCACQACGSAAPFTFQHNTLMGDVHDVRWTSFCHTRGIPHCLCGLVDMSIKDKKTCYDLW
jgi:hypothetical protein